MTIRVTFFAYLRDLFGGREKVVELDRPPTVGGLLSRISDTPERRREILKDDKLRSHLVVMVNGVHIGSLSGFDTLLAEGDTVAVFPFLAGG